MFWWYAGSDTWLANPALPQDILQEAVPGNIRRAEHFVAFLKRLVQYIKTVMNTEQVKSESPVSFVTSLQVLITSYVQTLRGGSEVLLRSHFSLYALNILLECYVICSDQKFLEACSSTIH